MSTFGLVLAKAVQTDLTADRTIAAADIVDVPEQSRDRLVSLLHRNEWNIARVARLMGDDLAWQQASQRCARHFRRVHSVDAMLAGYEHLLAGLSK